MALESEQQRAQELEEVSRCQEEQLSSVDAESMGVTLRQGLSERVRENANRRRLDPEETEALLAEHVRAVAGADFTGLGPETLEALIFRPALEALEKGFVDQPLLKTRLLQVVAVTTMEQGLLELAGAPQEEALEIWRRVLGDEHPYTARLLRAQRQVLRELERIDEARTLVTDFLATSSLPGDHPIRIEVRGLLEAADGSGGSGEGDGEAKDDD